MLLLKPCYLLFIIPAGGAKTSKMHILVGFLSFQWLGNHLKSIEFISGSPSLQPFIPYDAVYSVLDSPLQFQPL